MNIGQAAILSSILLTLFTSCSSGPDRPKEESSISGDLIIFHAGSLSIPFKEATAAFNQKYPDVNILAEPAGSVACIRKITDLGRPCDIMASADYKIIEKMLIPDYTGWHIPFVANEMVIAYHKGSAFAKDINIQNWPGILSLKEVRTGRSDSNADPCGYRTVIIFRLAERHYGIPGLADNLLSKDRQYIRPKEVDLLALLEIGEIDYIYIYRSVAEQHDLDYLLLPPSINLKEISSADIYRAASVEIAGKTPDSKITMKGEPMIYGITCLDDAPNKKAAMAFMEFMLAKNGGMKIMEANGQPSVVPLPSIYYESIPESLKKYVVKEVPAP